ncbi:DUF86 domain-containing protein [Roseofilum reptotaenium CS-1145]|uniref:DUF86 domain-containing protein n=1 Tax=Roseofilum reptotaenium AO1-A TaxID=1925591 RepID=A0A1L9QTT1_9CYAN|nr:MULTISPECIES: DUF86 domain-containing protein [Roseofilum]MBP0028305.1 DUF86 domain-containing protein [Roseofilum sp. Guam]MDB9518445.1 DUF86 domain-containing protein [Roseofilum reptotaenium CS-1145]OJJ26073.1 hypothetical protein BI308_07725 [Roseofilum reptotaenium AO1-A]
MPSRAWPLRIQDILDAIARIQQATAGMSYEQFEDMEDLVLHGILYNFVIIGEASINVNDSIKSRYPQIPWRLMGDMRNVMTHEYFRVKQRLVWNTIENHLPAVVPMLETLLQQEMGEE